MKKETQKTRKGHEIPIPKRDDVFKVFKNAATRKENPKKRSSTSRGPKK